MNQPNEENLVGTIWYRLDDPKQHFTISVVDKDGWVTLVREGTVNYCLLGGLNRLYRRLSSTPNQTTPE